MEQKRPADIFQELLDYLWNGLGLEEKGWKRLKKGDFKKKTEKRADLSDLVRPEPLQLHRLRNRPWKCGGGLQLYHKAGR